MDNTQESNRIESHIVKSINEAVKNKEIIDLNIKKLDKDNVKVVILLSGDFPDSIDVIIE
jgi:hypothetical protein